jgi:RNA polymerase sigma-70 factor (ECF subfamily)
MTAEPDLAALVRAHQAQLWRYLRFLGCEPSLAEDLTQETFLALVRRPPVLENVAALPAYLRTIARNLLCRRGTGGPAVLSLQELEEAEAVWSRTLRERDSDIYLEALRACIGGLDARSRRAIDLQYHDRMSREEAAKVLDLSPEGFKTLLRRIREQLKACVDGRLASE